MRIEKGTIWCRDPHPAARSRTVVRRDECSIGLKSDGEGEPEGGGADNQGVSFNVTEINTEKTGQIFGRLIPP